MSEHRHHPRAALRESLHHYELTLDIFRRNTRSLVYADWQERAFVWWRMIMTHRCRVSDIAKECGAHPTSVFVAVNRLMRAYGPSVNWQAPLRQRVWYRARFVAHRLGHDWETITSFRVKNGGADARGALFYVLHKLDGFPMTAIGHVVGRKCNTIVFSIRAFERRGGPERMGLTPERFEHRTMFQQEIAAAWGVSRERVRQVEAGAIAKLREQMAGIPEVREWLSENTREVA